MAYPTAAELKTFLLGAGLITDPTVAPDSYLDYQGAVDAASAQFEDDVKWFPYLSTGTPTARYFDPPVITNQLHFEGGLLALTSITRNGTALTQNTDFWLYPENAATQGKPYKYLKLYFNVWGLPRSIVITGTWGAVTAVPPDVKQAVLVKAAESLSGEILGKLSVGGVAEWKQGDTSIKYSNAGYSALPAQWNALYRDCVNRKRRG